MNVKALAVYVYAIGCNEGTHFLEFLLLAIKVVHKQQLSGKLENGVLDTTVYHFILIVNTWGVTSLCWLFYEQKLILCLYKYQQLVCSKS